MSLDDPLDQQPLRYRGFASDMLYKLTLQLSDMTPFC